MDIEAGPEDAAAKVVAGITDFEPGDMVGKILVFIAQVHSGGSEQAEEYLMHLCETCDCPKFELKTWVCTRWGSLSDCFKRVLSVRSVCNLTPLSFSHSLIVFVLQAIDMFCIIADKDKMLPALSHGKQYADFQLDEDEWEIISLAHQALAVRLSSLPHAPCLIDHRFPQMLTLSFRQRRRQLANVFILSSSDSSSSGRNWQLMPSLTQCYRRLKQASRI